MPGHRFVREIGSVAMLAAEGLAGVTPEVNLGEHITHTPKPSMNTAAHSRFENHRRRPQKSKTGISVAPEKGFMSLNYFNKNDICFHCAARDLIIPDVGRALAGTRVERIRRPHVLHS